MLKKLFIISLCLFECTNAAIQNADKAVAAKDSLSLNDSVHADTSGTDTIDCNFNQFMNDPRIPQLAKNLVNNTQKYPEDNEPLMFFNKLNGNNQQENAFYFRALNKSYFIADGAYSEGLGLSGKEYVEKQTKAFAIFFDNTTCFSDRDLATWADIVMLEFYMLVEVTSKQPIVKEYGNKLKSNCKGCTATQKETIDKFCKTLTGKWQAFLKKTDLSD